MSDKIHKLLNIGKPNHWLCSVIIINMTTTSTSTPGLHLRLYGTLEESEQSLKNNKEYASITFTLLVSKVAH